MTQTVRSRDHVVLGTRRSPLAREQTRRLTQRHSLEFSPRFFTTDGDQIQNRSLADIGGKGLFTKIIDKAVLAGEIDGAVHAAKDIEARLDEGLDIGFIGLADDSADALILRRQHHQATPTAMSIDSMLSALPLSELPKGARIGTQSPRRQAQIKQYRPDCHTVPMRGNVDTRLKKLEEQELDGLILARAGLLRLGLARTSTRLNPQEWLPAPCQGLTVIVCRKGDARFARWRAHYEHPALRARLIAERAMLAALGANCRTPIGSMVWLDGDQRLAGMRAALWDDNAQTLRGRAHLMIKPTRNPADAEELGQRLAAALTNKPIPAKPPTEASSN